MRILDEIQLQLGLAMAEWSKAPDLGLTSKVVGSSSVIDFSNLNCKKSTRYTLTVT